MDLKHNSNRNSYIWSQRLRPGDILEDNMVYIDGRWVKKPTKGRCAYCGSDLLEFYDDGTGICLNCGRTFSWLKPLSGPVTPQAQRAAPPSTQHGNYPPRSSRSYSSNRPIERASPSRSRPASTYRESPPAYTREPRKAPEPRAPVPTVAVPNNTPEGPGFLSPKAISILGFLGALLIGVGAILFTITNYGGSWPTDNQLKENLQKIGATIIVSGLMLFFMGSFSSAGTREMNDKVRVALIISGVLALIFLLPNLMGL